MPVRALTWTVLPEEAGRAVRSLAPARFRLGTHAFRRLKALGGILVNGEPAHAGRILRAGDVLEIRLDGGELPGGPPAPAGGCAVRYLDGDLVIVSKAAPLATLPGAHPEGDTLREVLAGMLGEDPEGYRYHPVNRLDKGTSGLLCVARHGHAQRLLAQQLHTDEFIREYLAVTEGIPEAAEGVIDAPIRRRGRGARRETAPDGKPAVTRYRVERTEGGRALLRLRLETGRTHQIRVHLASIGCPVCGDYLYGRELPELPGRFALHSARLACRQPVTGEAIDVEEPLPEELAALMSG